MPPVNYQAEAAVLGSMLIERPAIVKASAMLVPEDFYRDANRYIFEAILDLHERAAPVDLITLPEELKSRGHLETVGGSIYLQHLMEEPSTAANIEHYARLVKKEALKRDGILRAQEVHYLLLHDRLPSGEDVGDGLEYIARSDGRYNLSQVLSRGTACRERPIFRQVGQFLQEIGEPPPMLVERILPEKRLILCTGKPKLGKTLLSLDILHCVAAGYRVFQELTVNRPGPVIWLQMEDGDFETGERLLKRGLAPGNDLPIHLCTERINLSAPGSMEFLQEVYDQYRPVLVVIDTAREGLGIVKWEDPAEVADKTRPLREFARRNCSVLLVAHNRKEDGLDGDEISGTNAFTGAVDGWISGYKAVPLDNGNRRVFFHVVGRSNMHGELVVEMDTKTLCFRLIPAEELESEKQQLCAAAQSERLAPLIDACARLSEATVEQLAEACNLDYKRAQIAVRSAVRAGLMRDTGKRGGIRNNAPVYAVVPEAERDMEHGNMENTSTDLLPCFHVSPSPDDRAIRCDEAGQKTS
jgi:hypothetical protein